MRTADLECEWQVAPGEKGRPSLVSIVPGGSLTFEHRNIARKGRQARPPNPCSRVLWFEASTAKIGYALGRDGRAVAGVVPCFPPHGGPTASATQTV